MASVATIAIYSNCTYAREIRSYSGLRNSALYLGAKSCPSTWKLNTKKIDEIKELPNDKKAEIMTRSEDKELESVLTEKFLGYNRFKAGEGKGSFYIYETICSQCELNK